MFTDASMHGLGMVLMQKADNDNTLLFIFAASTGLKDSQKRYSTDRDACHLLGSDQDQDVSIWWSSNNYIRTPETL